jgi:hypothetical protein
VKVRRSARKSIDLFVDRKTSTFRTPSEIIEATIPVSGSTELDAYHETFSPCNPAKPAAVPAREFKLKHGPNEHRVLDPDFRAAFGNV